MAAVAAVLVGLTAHALSRSAPAPGPLSAGSLRPTGTSSPTTGDAGLLQSAQILQFLDRTVAWYRSRTAQEQIATEPADLVALADSRATAVQVVRAGFDFARAAAPLAAPEPAHGAGGAQPARSTQLLTLLDQLEQQARATDLQLQQQRSALLRSSGAARRTLESHVAALQAQLTLLQVRRDAVQQFLDFMDTTVTATSAQGLKGRIETLASAVDAEGGTRAGGTGAAGGPTPAGGATNTASAAATRASAASGGNGIWDLGARALALSSKAGGVDQFIHQTTALAQAGRGMRDLLFAALRRDSDRGDALTRDASAVDAAQLSQEQAELQALTDQFRQITAALVPLGKLSVLLAEYGDDLADWRDSVHREYVQTLRALGIRVALLVFIIAVILAASELWRRAVHRYVRDTRRRYQLLLLRRFVLWFVIVIVIASTLASRLDSFVTFAGLLTAGIAVAMQNVILSVVGYFFLIGKYGVRVGDRIQIGEVLGEVIDVGLVRMHLMELTSGTLTPTGRVVAFSNSIVFQATGGLFKQIPGVHIAWHELTVTLGSVAESADLRPRLLAAVQAALAGYREEIERQQRELERTSFLASGTVQKLQPSLRLRFLASGIEATVRYPVDQRSAADIDEAVSREVQRALQRDDRGLPAGVTRTELKLNSAPGG
ncbi:MAG TPA: mechanosensitive ion channel domain-containing protein [Steroidobacteraceae bacterium]|nr:mechanosensitive ion channel domain-containing protein [Steroidobacteraceae bacterium]